MTTNKAAAVVSEEMVRRALFLCPHELSTPAKHRWIANEINREVQAELGVAGWRSKDDLAELDFGVPVLVRLRGNPHTWTAMREYIDGEGWLWAMHSGGPLDDPDSYEADDDYDVEFWHPIPPPPASEEG